MNTYELTLLFAEGNDKERERVLKMIETAVKKAEGGINKQESWGAKHLAYPIKKMETAVYEHFLLTLPPAAQVELNRSLKLDESIVRYMFVRV